MINIEKIICCPFCKGDLEADAEDTRQGLPKSGHYYCAKCDRKFPLAESIVDFSPERPGKKSLFQQLMESNSFIRFYEGKSWRDSWLFSVYMGISLEKEMALIKEISHLKKDDTVLDLACGTGLYTRYLAEESIERNVIGMDISRPMLREAVRLTNEKQIENVAFLRGDSHYLPFKDFSIDVAVCCGSLHLFDDVSQVLNELSRAIRPGGHLALAVFLAESNLFGIFSDYWRKILYGIHPFSKTELNDLLTKANFKPAFFHAWGWWMVANGIREPI